MNNWRSIPGFEGTYEASSEGLIRRVAGGRGARAGHLVKPKVGKDGYLRVGLRRDHDNAYFTLHKLICQTFHGPQPSPRHTVAHANGVKADCTAGNLRWALHIDNLADKISHGTATIGTAAPWSKLTAAQVVAMRDARASGETITALAHRFMVSIATASRVVNGKTYPDVTRTPGTEVAA